ncbi:hypothetical protein D3C75_1293380 [compost metagenome]
MIQALRCAAIGVIGKQVIPHHIILLRGYAKQMKERRSHIQLTGRFLTNTVQLFIRQMDKKRNLVHDLMEVEVT